MGAPLECHEEEAAHCLALVIDHGQTLSLWDVDGQVRSFVFNQGKIQDLCFSCHGQNADDSLTPCLDEDGRHGTPEEGCFCGMGNPHLHAHVYDPETTCQSVDTMASSARNASIVEAALMKLARITLLPSQNIEENSASYSYRLPTSKQFPRDCNSKHIPKSVASRQDTSNFRRLAPVTHDDHTDHLIHNRETGHV
eukprot:CAMPEP_0176304100 /NCGR_PEP_ID=MMETSP0121_2-20121125/62256_1 /TAXON_ID=160619 /ORGANISM="Kryptoperidinium foliaceum, Strain CCMP 1326" /LENGTH=195 /DNA_ID=CAMNT_0017645695 /DNA_START=39 /DNA_END=623 /DNA_ORIENTATION=+